MKNLNLLFIITVSCTCIATAASFQLLDLASRIQYVGDFVGEGLAGAKVGCLHTARFIRILAYEFLGTSLVAKPEKELKVVAVGFSRTGTVRRMRPKL